MALQLDKKLDTSITGNYWRVVRVNWAIVKRPEQHDSEGNIITLAGETTETQVSIALYVDAQARQDGAEPLTTHGHIFQGAFTIEAMTAKNPVALAYEKLKELPEWAGAKDA